MSIECVILFTLVFLLFLFCFFYFILIACTVCDFFALKLSNESIYSARWINTFLHFFPPHRSIFDNRKTKQSFNKRFVVFFFLALSLSLTFFSIGCRQWWGSTLYLSIARVRFAFHSHSVGNKCVEIQCQMQNQHGPSASQNHLTCQDWWHIVWEYVTHSMLFIG